MPVFPSDYNNKAGGMPILADDWNEVVDQVDARVLKSGDHMTGSLTIGGNVGIKTTSPAKALEVAGDTLIEGPDGFNSQGEEAVLCLGDGNHFVKATHSSGLTISTYANNPGIFLKEGGGVGIATNQPKESFQIGERLAIHHGGDIFFGINQYWDDSTLQLRRIVSGMAAELRFQADGKIRLRTQALFAPANGSFAYYSQDGITVTTDAVGIGTENPGAKLEVSGGPNWTSNNWKKSIKIANGSAIHFDAGPNKFGIGATNSGSSLFFFSTQTDTNVGQLKYRLRIEDTGKIFVDTGKSPVELIRFPSIGSLFNTNYSSVDYDAAIVGFQNLNAGYNDSISSLYTYIAGGTWWIGCEQSVGPVTVLFIRREISWRTGF